MESPTLTFLIGTRNRRDSLLRCIRSIARQRYAPIEVVVVIDGSDDGSAEALASDFPEVVRIELPTSGGIGPGLACGAAKATGDIIVNLDDDCELTTDDTAQRIAQTFAENPSFGVLCFKVQAPDGSVRHREIPLRSKKLPSEATEIAYFLGGAVAFRAECLAEAGGYPTEVVWGSWENTVSFRLAKTDWRILFVPEIVVRHYAIPSPTNTDYREANYIRSETQLAATFLPSPYAQVHAGLWIAQSLAQAAAHRRFKRALGGLRQGLSEWGDRRADKALRLTSEETRRLSRLSGRTWY